MATRTEIQNELRIAKRYGGNPAHDQALAHYTAAAKEARTAAARGELFTAVATRAPRPVPELIVDECGHGERCRRIDCTTRRMERREGGDRRPYGRGTPDRRKA
jgi:hypothetical protein